MSDEPIVITPSGDFQNPETLAQTLKGEMLKLGQECEGTEEEAYAALAGWDAGADCLSKFLPEAREDFIDAFVTAWIK